MDTIIRYTILLLSLWLLPQIAQAQLMLPDSLVKKAQRYSRVKQFDSAALMAEQALAKYTEPRQRAWAYYELGYAQRRLDQLAVATDNLINAIRSTRDSTLRVKAHYELGRIYSGQVQPESAIYHYERALLFNPDTLSLVKIYTGIADEHNYYFANYLEAEDFYERALRHLQSLSKGSQTSLLLLLYNLAAVHQQRDDLYAALDYALQATQIAKKTRSINLEVCYSLLGTIYHQLQQYPAAIAAYQSAIEQGIESGGKMNADLPRYYNNLGLLFSAQGKYEQAIPYFQQAQQITVNHNYPRSVADRADSHQYLGDVYTQLGNFSLAHTYLSEALLLKRSFYGNTHPEIARTLERFCSYYQEQQQLDSALHFQQQALIAEIPKFSAQEIRVNPHWDLLQDYSQVFVALNTKAELLHQRYQQKKQLSDLTLAIATFARADSLIHLHRISYEYESSQLQLLEKQKSSYEMAVASCYLAYEATKDEAYAKQGLYFMERSKAVILWDVLRDVAARSNLGVSDSLQREERTIKAQLTRLVNEMTEERRQPIPNQAKLDSLQEKRFGLHRRQTHLQEKLTSAYPSYVQLKYASPTLPWGQIQQKLSDQQQNIVEFFWGTRYAYALKFSQRETQFYRMPISDQLVTSIQRLRQLLQQGPSPDNYTQETKEYLALASYIYQTCLAPAFSNNESPSSHLTLVPDGPLSYLPFEALLTKDVPLTNNPDYRTFPYLLRKSTVQYSPSLQVLFNNQTKQSASNSNAFLRLLAFGFTHQLSRTIATERAGLVALPGTFREIKAIERLTSAQLLAGAEASETHFKRHAENYQVLHLALHGLADSVNANNNILFFPATSDSINDGELHSFELYDLQLTDTKLAVLSACETGTGRWEEGEGVYSMGRGFAYAGCPSVVMSLWKVNDAFTARIMPTFYRSLFKGTRIDQSLRSAKLRFIERANKYQAHPSYWAAFVLQGKLAPIVHYQNTYLAGLLTLFIGLGYFLVGFTRKKKPAL
ncbi:CHAT domain-containing tetratricopeptide repeat protein [Tunicatimonas pelagia]|uniref:CHAT domain-containing tetratricopeptide repeat protein n=1 Tax=Tunicatimonas pelagia TaxID=931531 RepID=UPI0026660F1B|nr:CHAT domain-containing protein [Tunicatimonas pelagia]WKN43803.1 CHAT domain-containing protein [Tunicatimonas pelagia]